MHGRCADAEVLKLGDIVLLTLRARQVNPEIRGGLVVEIGDRTIDLSVSAKIAKMNKLLQDSL